MKTCGSPSCRCATDPDARHGPYYEWGHMKAGKLLHRLVSPPQAEALRLSIANYRKAKKLLRAWEAETDGSSTQNTRAHPEHSPRQLTEQSGK
jgi:hypothetical protein